MRTPIFLSASLLILVGSQAHAAEPAGKLKVFILAGQSNMEGKARLKLLEYQIKAPETRELFKHLHQDGKFLERDDVWIEFLGRRGKLTVGFGSPGCIGPELEFGNVVGDHFKEPVLLIKTAWGGKSLGRDFRPPSSGLPAKEKLEEIVKQTNERNAKKNQKPVTYDQVKDSYGHYYRQMLQEIDTTLKELKTRFPEYQGQGYELAGFVWFQGWNDMFDEDFRSQYATHMANFIRDVRKDLKAPGLPFVIGEMGQNGFEEANANMAAIKKAQAAMADIPEFKGNVKVVKTDILQDKKAAELYKNWQDHKEEWDKVGSDRAYHYLGSAITFSRIGKAFGQAMLELMTQKKASTRFYDPVEKELEGWTILVDPGLLAQKELADKCFKALGNHLQRIEFIVPEERVARLKKVRIWIELENPTLKAMQYHPGKGWLVEHGQDPRLVKHVHVPRARDLIERRTWAKHPYVVLHELAHAYHDQVLGFDDREIRAAWDAAREKGIYDKVLLFNGQTVKHYALTSPMEYFAESTEAYFGVNDFYPFVRAELKQHDPVMYSIQEKVWGPVAK
ncbi:MAG: sialate O-acetylesterase [Gemmataceae bacterium]